MANNNFILETLKKICNDYRKNSKGKGIPSKDPEKYFVKITTELGEYHGIPILIDENRLNPTVVLANGNELGVVPIHNGERDPVLIFNSKFLEDFDQHAKDSGIMFHKDMTPLPRGLLFYFMNILNTIAITYPALF